jgi:hypothetical protein
MLQEDDDVEKSHEITLLKNPLFMTPSKKVFSSFAKCQTASPQKINEVDSQRPVLKKLFSWTLQSRA